MPEFDADLAELRRRSQPEPSTPAGAPAMVSEAETHVDEDIAQLRNSKSGVPSPVDAQATPDTVAPRPLTRNELAVDELDVSLRHAATSDPAGEAQRRNLANRLGVPKELVPDGEDADREIFLKENDPEALLRSNPAVAAYLNDLDNAAVAGRDVGTLKKIERTMARLALDPLVAAAKTTVAVPEVLSGAYKIYDKAVMSLIPASLKTAVDNATPQEAMDALANVKDTLKGLVDFQQTQEVISKLYSPETQAAQRKMSEAKGFGNVLKAAVQNPSAPLAMVGESIGPMFLGGAVSKIIVKAFPALGPLVAGAAGEGTVIAGGIAQGITDETGEDLTGKQALLAAGGGALGTVVGVLGGKIMDKLGVLDVDTAIAKGTLATAMKEAKVPHHLATRILAGAAGEGVLEEMPQSAIEQIAHNIGTGKVWDEGVEEAMAMGLVAGGTIGGAIQVFAPKPTKHVLSKATDEAVLDALRNVGKAQQAEDARTTLDEFSRDAAASTLRKNSPEEFKKFVRAMSDEGGMIEEVFIDPAKLSEAFAQSELTEEEIKDKMPDVAAAMAEAQETGSDVRISFDDYATYIVGSKAETPLLDHLRTTPEGMTYSESQQFFQGQEAELTAQAKKILEGNQPVLSKKEFEAEGEGDYQTYLKDHQNKAEAFAADSKQVHDTILQGLAKTQRFNKPVNAVYSLPFREFFATAAAKEGIMPSEMYARMPLNFANIKIDDGLLTQPAENIATQESFSKENIQDALTDIDWMIMTGHNPADPLTKAAYAAMIAETTAQYKMIVEKTGLVVEFVTGKDPYAGNPRAMTEDVRDNNHMWVFGTRDGFGTDMSFDPKDNPLLGETDVMISGQKALANDLFRMVHDYFGHVKEGVGFRADGEENTWRSHAAMFTPLARRALTTETRGQNSWLNFGPFGEVNRTDPMDLLAQSTRILKGQENLKKFGLKPGQPYSTREVAAALEARQRAKYGSIAKDDRSKDALKRISSWMADEVVHEMLNPEGSGVGWYSEKFQNALDIMGQKYPELKDDQGARDTMTALIAVTSDSQTVAINTMLADRIYAGFRESGRFEAGVARAGSVKGNLKVLQELYDTMGVAKTHEYLMAEMKVSDLKKEAAKGGNQITTPYQAHIKVPMAALELGPKLGAFYANLMGSHGYLTMDRWWSRTFNRYRGSLLDAPTQSSIDNFAKLVGKEGQSNDEILAATVAPKEAYEARDFKTRLALLVGGSQIGTNTQKADWLVKAKELAGDRFDELFAEHNLERAANTVYRAAFIKTLDTPFNSSDRTFMLDATAEARRKLSRRGIKMSIADIQAVLWYYEKKLYGELGAKQTAKISYEEAATGLLTGRFEEGAGGASDGGLPLPPEGLQERLSPGESDYIQSVSSDQNFFQFAGPLAETADQFALERAQTLEASGMHKDDVQDLTGWFRGMDDMWRFEIDDSQAAMSKSYQKRGTSWGEMYSAAPARKRTLGDAVSHPRLFAAYPQLKDMRVGILYGENQDGASFTPATEDSAAILEIGSMVKGDMVLSFIMHEVQHGLQNIEGFARGGTPEGMYELQTQVLEALAPDYNDREVRSAFSVIDAASDKLRGMALSEAEVDAKLAKIEKTLTDKYPKFKKYTEAVAKLDFSEDPFMAYRRLAGEIEARNTQARLGLDANARKILSPEATQDVKSDRAIVVFRGKEAANMPPPANVGFAQTHPAFFSALQQEIPGISKVANKEGMVKPDQAIAWINSRQKEGKFKKDEIEAVGILDWLATREDPVSVQELTDFVRENGVEVVDVTLGSQSDMSSEDNVWFVLDAEGEVEEYFTNLADAEHYVSTSDGVDLTIDSAYDPDVDEAEDGETKFEDYVLDGGENYKELLLILPGERKFQDTAHFDEENILTHIRFNERSVKLPPTEAESAVQETFRSDAEARAKLLRPLEVERKATSKVYSDYLDSILNTGDAKLFNAIIDGREQPPAEIVANNERNTEIHEEMRAIRADIVQPAPLTARTENVLFIEEIQSDWAQAGRKKGFTDSARASEVHARQLEIESQMRVLQEAQTPGGRALGQPAEGVAELQAEWEALRDEKSTLRGAGRVKTGPFVKDTKAWTALALKRMMRYAADNGFDRIAWTTGAQQADRYDLSEKVEAIWYSENSDGTRQVTVYTPGGISAWSAESTTQEALADVIGKGPAQQVFGGEGETTKSGKKKIKGLNLRVGGEGMLSYYDKIVPQVANDVLKKLKGGKVEVLSMGKGGGKQVGDQLSFEITPELRETISQGLPLFQEQAPQQQIRAAYDPTNFTIALLEGADLSSVIHEGAHFYLEALSDMAAQPNAIQQVKDDFRKTLEWFGINGGNPEATWRIMTLDQKREFHEQWAQSYERYALEGKAPTLAMQPVFARFRTWMLSVYKNLSEFLKQNPLAGRLNDDLRQVFDRLLAAEEAIAEAEKAREYAPLFANAAEAGVSEKEFIEYMDAGKDATSQAVDELGSRSLRDMQWLSNAKDKTIKALQHQAREQRKVIMDEVMERVQAEPVNQARRLLRKGELRSDDGTMRELAEHKLDTAAVKSLRLDMPLNRLSGMTKPGGLAPDLAAQFFGFSSGDALIEALLTEPSASDKAHALTDKRMLEEHGDLVDPESIARAAEKAIHNEARARFMATGLKMLMKTPAGAKQMAEAAKQAAESAIAQKKVRELSPAQYARAEKKANREAITQAAKDTKKAVEAQRAALLNNRLSRAASDAQLEVESALRYLKKFDSPAVRKKLHIDHLEQIDDMRGSFDLRKGVTKKALDKRKSLHDWIDQQEADGFEPVIDPAVMDELKRKHYKDMTLSEIRGLVDTIKQIEHVARRLKQVLTLKDKREFNAVVDDAEASLELHANRVVPERGTPTDVVGMTAQWGRQMAAAHRKFNSIIREMDGGKDNGTMWNLFSRGMNEAGDIETEMKQVGATKIAELFNNLTREGTVPGNLYSKKTLVPNTNLSMTHEQRIMFAMNWGNEGNRQRLLDGGITGARAISSPDAKKVLETLTKEDWDFVQGVWDFIGGYKGQIASLERKMTGVTPEWVEASPVETRFGTYSGGYFPAKYDTELSTRSESLEAANDSRMGMKGAFQSAAARNGFAKKRAEEVINRPLLLSYNVISQHVSEVTHRLAWTPWLFDANRLLKALDSPIRRYYGVEILKEMKDTTIDIAMGDAPAKNAMEKAINRLRVGSTVVGMGWRFTTALLQPSGLSQSWARIGGRWMAKGIGRFYRHPFDSGAFVNEKSRLMKDRGITMQREINEVLNVIRAGDKVGVMKASFFTMIAKMQRTVDIPTWLGAYEKGLEQLKYENETTAEGRKAVEEHAVALADQAVIDSQSGGQLKDLARVQRGHPAWKLFTNFYSYFSAAYNLNIEAVRRTDFKSPSQVGLLAVDMVLINILPVIFSVALKLMMKGGCRPDDLECIGEKLAQEQLGHLMGQMVILREAGAAVAVATGGDGFGYQGPAGVRFFGDLYKLGQQANQGEADMALFKAANSVGGAILHYPAGQINATLDGIIAVERGDVEGVSILPALLAGPPRK